jgi:hypothetical protein
LAWAGEVTSSPAKASASYKWKILNMANNCDRIGQHRVIEMHDEVAVIGLILLGFHLPGLTLAASFADSVLE